MGTAPCFDADALVRLHRLGGVQLLRQMLNLFLENLPQRLEAVRQGSQEGDLEAVQRAVHSLKSTAGNLGLRALQELATQIEHLATTRQSEAIATRVHDLEAACARILPLLQQQRDGLEP